jgi:peroxiredoxin
MRGLRNFWKRGNRGRTMTALAVGTKAPDFELKGMDGQKFSLGEALASGPVLLAFFKVGCPTCQYTFPFLDRLYRSYRGSQGQASRQKISLVGISQNDAKQTAAFASEFGVTFPVLLDERDSYPVSNAYGLTNVPTLFWIAQDGEIELSSVGWVKADFEAINRKMAEAGKAAPAAVFKPGEDVRDFRAG